MKKLILLLAFVGITANASFDDLAKAGVFDDLANAIKHPPK